MKPSKITIFHSPDADDAFMFYGLTSGAVSSEDFEFEHELSDIESLNNRAMKGEIDVTAVSVHAYAYLADQYVILNCGASMGEKDYGPRLVVSSEESRPVQELKSFAIPGKYTSASLAFQLWAKEHDLTPEIHHLHFDEVQHAVGRGEIDAGVLIHEGQITHERDGLKTLVDFGAWWWQAYKLPLPLGVNVIKRELGDKAIQETKRVLKESIEHSLTHRTEALEYALSYGRGLSKDDADTFVGMYVNQRTLDLGEEGRKSIELFLAKGYESGILPKMVMPDFV